MFMANEKIMELSTQILCALINQGFVPPALVGKSVESASGMVRDYLDSLAVQVKSVYHNLEKGNAPEHI